MLIKQSESTAARRTIYFTAVNIADGSGHTSTISAADIKLSKAGAAEVSATNSSVHIATGLHKLELTAEECDTVGELSVRLNKTGVYNDVRVLNVIAFDPYSSSNLGLSNIDAAISSRLATTAYSSPSSLLTFADGVETNLTVQGALRLITAVLGGRLSGSQTGVEVFRNAVADNKNRVTATIDASGNRTNIATDLT